MSGNEAAEKFVRLHHWSWCFFWNYPIASFKIHQQFNTEWVQEVVINIKDKQNSLKEQKQFSKYVNSYEECQNIVDPIL